MGGSGLPLAGDKCNCPPVITKGETLAIQRSRSKMLFLVPSGLRVTSAVAEDSPGQQEVRVPRSPNEGPSKGEGEDMKTEGLTLQQRKGFFQISSLGL